jgi:hypothetical protein
MMDEVKATRENLDTLFPALKGRRFEIAGFVWFQGWNDQYGGQDEYAANLKHLIHDVRKDLGVPKLPFVIAAMGQNGSKPAEGAMLTVRQAQLSMNDVPEFRDRRARRQGGRGVVSPLARELRRVEEDRRRLRLPLSRQRDLVQPNRQRDGRGDAGLTLA